MRSRQEKLGALRQGARPEVLIVGAGVNGIGTFRDLALQGVDVLVVDRGDFCSGASMASSHMLHGGIRYLEHGELRLVREALRERNRLLRGAPHLARPLPTAIPIRRRFSGLANAPLKLLGLRDRPSERGALVIELGLMLYDAYVRGQSPMPGHRLFGRSALRRRWPALHPEVRYVGRYHDAAMPSPERICIEMVADAEALHAGAMALNYVEVVDLREGEVVLRDALTGEALALRPQVVVNAAGPWIDGANACLGRPSRFIGGTKGSHLVVDHPGLRAALAEHELFFEHRDGRIVLICPYQDRVLIGTTDIRIDDPDAARCTEAEVDCLLGMVGQVFPGLEPTREQIVFHFSGVRPLPASPEGFTGNISRDHRIEVQEAGEARPFPVLSLVGGKWTTFRALAEKACDAVLARLGRPRLASTAELPIGGGKGHPADEAAAEAWIEAAAERHGLPRERVRTLFERYGTGADDLAAELTRAPDPPLEHLPDYSRREIRHLVLREQVVHLDDLLLRRSLIAWLGQASGPAIAELAEVTGEALGWDAARRRGEVERTRGILAERHGVVFGDDVGGAHGPEDS